MTAMPMIIIRPDGTEETREFPPNYKDADCCYNCAHHHEGGNCDVHPLNYVYVGGWCPLFSIDGIGPKQAGPAGEGGE